MSQLARSHISGPCYRIINSRYPTIGVFDAYCDDEEELRIAFELEQATNPRLNEAMGALALLPEGSLLTGSGDDGASMGMAAFLHCSPGGGRFHGNKLGAWYGAMDTDTAIAETLYHNERRIRLSSVTFPTQIQVRQLITTMDQTLIDLCGHQEARPELYHLEDYSASQQFAESIRWPANDPGEDGLIYDSVRHDGGVNVCIFRPQALSLPIVQGDHLQYDWDANGMVSVTKLTQI